MAKFNFPVMLFGEEQNLFNPNYREVSSYESQGYLNEEDKKRYLLWGGLDDPTRYTTLCGPYQTTVGKLQNSVNEIVKHSLADGCEYGSLILYENQDIELTKKISFTECTGGTSPTRMDTSVLTNPHNHARIIGLLHSHMLEDSSDELGNLPSVGDFLRYDKCLIGIIRPKKRKLLFYKIKAPMYPSFNEKFAGGLIKPAFSNQNASEWQREIKKYCLCEEVPLDQDYTIIVPA